MKSFMKSFRAKKFMTFYITSHMTERFNVNAVVNVTK